eukprot:SAG11_NODE_7585_length_1125_cov_1.537037_1_plen_60_part_01
MFGLQLSAKMWYALRCRSKFSTKFKYTVVRPRRIRANTYPTNAGRSVAGVGSYAYLLPGG